MHRVNKFFPLLLKARGSSTLQVGWWGFLHVLVMIL